MRDALDHRRAALLDSTLRLFVGHDLFFFADAASRDRFAKDPLRHVKALTDPVSRVRFKPSRRSPHAEFEGRAYYFSSDSTLAEFRASSARFVLGRGGMTH